MTVAQPYLVVDARTNQGQADTPPYQAFLTWLRSEGIDPDKGRRCEVYEGSPPYAVLTMFTFDDKGAKVVDEARMEYVTRVETVTLSSLPPAREV